jgi:hypothetical protein
MRYGRIINGGCLVRESPADGYKLIIDTPPETPDGFRAVSRYVEDGDAIRPVWEYIELTEEEKEEIERRGIDNSEAFGIIFGGGDA